MKSVVHSKTVIPSLVVTLALAYFWLLPKAQAVVPPPDGGYPGFTTAEGQNALFSLTTGAANTAVGWYSLFSETTGSFNTATGAGALLFNTADENTAFGTAALLFNTSGIHNTAVGTAALLNNTTSDANTATGSGALSSHTTGNANTANGANALFSDATGQANTATGAGALFSNTTGGFNTANGFGTLFSNTTGGADTAIGAQALANNTMGNENTAVGLSALATNTTGSDNVALGTLAGNGQTTGTNNVYIGANMLGTAGESDACYIRSIFGQTSANGIAVLVNSDNKLGTMTSSKRFKEEIRPMDKASEALLKLKPVTFRYKKEIDPEARQQFGLVAEEVEKVNPNLVVRDKEGKPYSVRYDQVNAMLLNEFLKEHATVLELKKEIATLTATVREQGAQIQKVSAHIETSKPAAQAVVTNP